MVRGATSEKAQPGRVPVKVVTVVIHHIAGPEVVNRANSGCDAPSLIYPSFQGKYDLPLSLPWRIDAL
jgi:hypothetical protein